MQASTGFLKEVESDFVKNIFHSQNQNLYYNFKSNK